MIRRTVAEIRLPALRHNFKVLSQMAAPRAVIPVVKDNAFGHGAVLVSRELVRLGARLLAVVTLDEALEIRSAGLGVDLLVMGVVEPSNVPEAIAADCIIGLHSLDHASAVEAAARGLGKVLRVHVKVDTGMNRLGMSHDDARRVFSTFSGSPHLRLEGLMSHMYMSDESDPDASRDQISRLAGLVAQLTEQNLRPRLVHLANSGGVLRFESAYFDAVRPGFSLYGHSPCPGITGQMHLQPVMRWRTTVALLKRLEVGHGVSYGHTWRASRPTLLAALPVGYGDGYPRAFSNTGRVIVCGKTAPVAGRVCMDTTMIDVTDIPGVEVGSTVDLMQADPESPISAYKLAEALNTIPHELMVTIGRRVQRVGVED